MKNLNRHLMKTENSQPQNLGEKKMKAKKLFLCLVVLSILSFAASVSAGVPQMINYQGVLTDPGGCPEDGNFNMVFRIYPDSAVGTELWEDFLSAVPVTKGNFNVLLAIPGSLFVDTTELWLAVQVGNDPEMTPRQRIASVGYAFRSEFADTAEYAVSAPRDDDWAPDTSGFNIYRLTGNVGIGTPSPDYKLDVDDGDVRVQHDLYVNGRAVITGRVEVDTSIKFEFDYDSDWFSISPGGTVTKTHGLGGDPSKYIVFMDGKSSNGGIHQSDFGTACYGLVIEKCVGCEWYGLSSSQITVHRAPDDAIMSPNKDWYRCRIRILTNQ